MSDSTDGESPASRTDWYKELLAKPPVPSLERTFERYLQYAGVVAESVAHGTPSLDTTNLAVSRFFPVAERLQAELRQIADRSDNWINEFWLPEMYLMQRAALPVNFSPAYVFPRQRFTDELDQLDYAAWLVRGIMNYKDKIDKRQLPCDVNRGRVNSRLCMAQYDRLLASYREPAFGADVHRERWRDAALPTEEHILVLCDRQTFIVFTRLAGQLLSQSVILEQLRTVAQMAINRPTDTVVPMGAATVGGRDDAARFWMIMKEAPLNVVSLNWVSSATFTLCIDRNESPSLCAPRDPKHNALERAGLHILHGYGSSGCGLNRWFDATIQLIVSRSGYSGLCIEHSIAEGIVIIQMAETALRFTYDNRARRMENASTRVGGVEIVAGTSNARPRALSWVLNEDAHRILDREIEEFDRLTDDLQLRVLVFDDFGKTVIKALRVSPDGFAQLALQLAHFRLHGCLVSTYESATMRKYRLGRVDNIRAATPEAHAWVREMDTTGVDRKTKRQLFQKAADKQSLITQENVNGEGIDNHLCALNVLARRAVADGWLHHTPELFQDRMWAEVMRFPLSTSQVTTSPEFTDCYLYYGPVVADGYGCAYNIQDGRMIFAVSAFRANDRTQIDGFRTNLAHALRDMRTLLTDLS